MYDEISTETRKIFDHIINVSGDHAVGLLSCTAMIAGVCRKSSFVCVFDDKYIASHMETGCLLHEALHP